MRFNSKILSVIISLAFVGGMFSAVYAGPVIATITLDGNVHTTGDSVVDGDLIVGTVSFADLDARVAALELDVPPQLTNTITTHGDMITTQGDMITTQGDMITANQDNITLNQNSIESNAQAIAEGGGGPSPCDPDNSSSITPQEMFDYMQSNGSTINLVTITSLFISVESSVPPFTLNGLLDTDAEISQWNNLWLIPAGISPCPFF